MEENTPLSEEGMVLAKMIQETQFMNIVTEVATKAWTDAVLEAVHRTHAIGPSPGATTEGLRESVLTRADELADTILAGLADFDMTRASQVRETLRFFFRKIH